MKVSKAWPDISDSINFDAEIGASTYNDKVRTFINYHLLMGDTIESIFTEIWLFSYLSYNSY